MSLEPYDERRQDNEQERQDVNEEEEWNTIQNEMEELLNSNSSATACIFIQQANSTLNNMSSVSQQLATKAKSIKTKLSSQITIEQNPDLCYALQISRLRAALYKYESQHITQCNNLRQKNTEINEKIVTSVNCIRQIIKYAGFDNLLAFYICSAVHLLDHRKHKIELLTAMIETLTTEAEEQRSDVREVLATYKQLLREVKEEAVSSMEEAVALKVDNEQLEKQLSGFRNSCTSLQQEHQALQAEAQQRDDAEDANRERRRVETEAVEQHTHLREQLEETKKKLADSREEATQLQARNEILESEIAEQWTEAGQSRRQLEEAQARISSLEDVAAQRQARIASLESETAEQRAGEDQSRRQLEEAQARITALEDVAAQRQAGIESLESQKAEHRARIAYKD